MKIDNTGAKEARQQIKQFQRYINSPRLVPDQCYRMASSTFPLVCYVNQITGLYLSKNYSVIPIFLSRAYDQVKAVRHELVSDPYRSLVIQYLSHVAHFLTNYSALDEDEEHLRQWIPAELLEIKPTTVPEELQFNNEF